MDGACQISKNQKVRGCDDDDDDDTTETSHSEWIH